MKPDILAVEFSYKPESRLWDLDIPTEEVAMSFLVHNLDIPYLDKEGTDDWNLTPRMLVEHTEKEPGHMKKVENADLSFPIEIYENKGVWIILDGVHRFTKAVIQGSETMKVRKVTKDMLESIQ